MLDQPLQAKSTLTLQQTRLSPKRKTKCRKAVTKKQHPHISKKLWKSGKIVSAEYPPIYLRILTLLTYKADTIFNPMIELMRVAIKSNRKKVIGSLNTNIPTKTVPTAPIPVQTA